MIEVGQRYQFVSPAGQRCDSYEVIDVQHPTVWLTNKHTRKKAWASPAWLVMPPCPGRAHWLSEDES